MAFALVACAEPLPLEGRPCPCANGFQCCASTQTCIPVAARCLALPTSDAESEAVTPSPDAFFDGTALGRDATVGPLDDDARAEVGSPADASARDAASEQGIPVLADVRALLIDASTDAYLDRVP